MLRELYEESVKTYLNNDFEGATGDSLPPSVRLAVDKLMQGDKNKTIGVSTKRQGDVIEASYRPEAWSNEVKMLIQPYRKMRF